MDNAFIYLQFLRNSLLPLPGVSEKLCYGTPGFYAGKKMFVRLKENGETLVVATSNRDYWIARNPDVYFITDHYRNYDYMLISLPKADAEEVKQLLLTSWQERTGKKALAEYNNNAN